MPSDAERNRKLAEIAGYEWFAAAMPMVIIKGHPTPWSPITDANQMIECLDRVCCLEKGGSWDTATVYTDGRKLVGIWIYMPGATKDQSIDGNGTCFCLAAEAAILAAGGKK